MHSRFDTTWTYTGWQAQRSTMQRQKIQHPKHGRPESETADGLSESETADGSVSYFSNKMNSNAFGQDTTIPRYCLYCTDSHYSPSKFCVTLPQARPLLSLYESVDSLVPTVPWLPVCWNQLPSTRKRQGTATAVMQRAGIARALAILLIACCAGLVVSHSTRNVFAQRAETCRSMHVLATTASEAASVFLDGCYHRSESFTTLGRSVYHRESYGPEEVILGMQHQDHVSDLTASDKN